MMRNIQLKVKNMSYSDKTQLWSQDGLDDSQSESADTFPSTIDTAHNYRETDGIEIKNSNNIDAVLPTQGDTDPEIMTSSGTYIVIAEQHLHAKTTNMECLMHLLKGMIGTGILAMPIAYKNGGLWTSFGIVILMGVVCTHCMHLVVIAGNEICKRTGVPHIDLAGAVEKAFATGGDRWKRWSQLSKNLVNLFLMFTQFGFCCVYNVFVADNIKQVVEHQTSFIMDQKLYMIIIGAMLIPYVMVKSLKALAPFSTVANLLNLFGLAVILYNLLQDLAPVENRPAFGKISTLPLFFGQAVFAFEGIGLVLPLHNKMKDKEAFLGKAGVLNLGLAITISLYSAIGFYGYLKYGDDTQGSVTLNLPSNNWLYLSVKLAFAVSLFITYGLQYYVPVNIIWPFIVHKAKQHGKVTPKYMEYLFRLVLVVLLCGLSVLVPHLDLLISLVGAFSSSFLAIIMPPIIELITFETSTLVRIKDWLIIFVGLVGFLTGTYSSLVEIGKTF